MVIPCVTFKEPPNCSPQLLDHFISLPPKHEGSNFSTFARTLVILFLCCCCCCLQPSVIVGVKWDLVMAEPQLLSVVDLWVFP